MTISRRDKRLVEKVEEISGGVYSGLLRDSGSEEFENAARQAAGYSDVKSMLGIIARAQRAAIMKGDFNHATRILASIARHYNSFYTNPKDEGVLAHFSPKRRN